MNTVFGRGYPEPPKGVSKSKGGKACDAVAMAAWTRGIDPDWREVKVA